LFKIGGNKIVKYGYARVSTLEQNLDRQIETLKEAGCQYIFEEKISGATLERAELKRLMSMLKNGDKIIIHDITRFGRSTLDLLNLIEEIKARGASLRSINESWLNTSDDNPFQALLLTILSALAQYERELIRKRQAEGIAIAKKKGVYKGRPKTFTNNNPRLLQALELKEQGMSYKEASKRTGVSESTIYRAWKNKD